MVTTLTTFPALSPKSLRYVRRETSRDLSHVGKNPPKCGQTRRMARVDLVVTGKSAWFRGLVSCAQVWACPVCAYRVANFRGNELLKVLEGHRKAGGGVYLVTLTLPHDEGDQLKRLRQSVSTAWSKTISGKEWIRMKSRLGYLGYVRALEVTHGPNGWHPHLHVLIFVKIPISDGEMWMLQGFLHARWCSNVEKFGYRRPSLEHGVKISEGEDAGNYVSKICKQGLAAETTLGLFKNSRNGYRTVLQILDDYRSTPTEKDKKLLEVWIRSMYGARQLTWGGDIRRRYVQEPEITDAQAIEEEDRRAVAVVCFPPDVWDAKFKCNPVLRWRLIEELERAGPLEIRDFVRTLLPERDYQKFVAMQRFLN